MQFYAFNRIKIESENKRTRHPVFGAQLCNSTESKCDMHGVAYLGTKPIEFYLNKKNRKQTTKK